MIRCILLPPSIPWDLHCISKVLQTSLSLSFCLQRSRCSSASWISMRMPVALKRILQRIFHWIKQETWSQEFGKQDDPGDQVNPDVQPKMFHYWDKSAVRIWSIFCCSDLLCVGACFLLFSEFKTFTFALAAFAVAWTSKWYAEYAAVFPRFVSSVGILLPECVHKIFRLGSVCWLWATLRHLQVLREQFQQPRPLRCALQGEITPGTLKAMTTHLSQDETSMGPGDGRIW